MTISLMLSVICIICYTLCLLKTSGSEALAWFSALLWAIGALINEVIK